MVITLKKIIQNLLLYFKHGLHIIKNNGFFPRYLDSQNNISLKISSNFII